MSRTLFGYIFSDMFKVFMVASGALAGIMSFGGLLRPLTREELDAAQVVMLLGYFTPAMTSYSFPIAALFAASIIYGRLSSDNEITACRASGISALSINTPGMVLGLGVALTSLVFLCYIVPWSSLKVEKVIYANVARFISGQINRNHEIKFGGFTIFAQDAVILDTNDPNRQAVKLVAPMIVQYKTNDDGIREPRDFYMASEATVSILMDDDQEMFTLDAELVGGVKVPHSLKSGLQGGINVTRFRSEPMSSLLRENVRFMSVDKLHEVYHDLNKSRRMKKQQRQVGQRVIRLEAVRQLTIDLAEGDKQAIFEGTDGSRYELAANESVLSGDEYDRLLKTPDGRKPPVLREITGATTLDIAAKDVRISLTSDVRARVHYVVIKLDNAELRPPNGERIPRQSIQRNVTIPMTPREVDIISMTVPEMDKNRLLNQREQMNLKRQLMIVRNGVISEAHARMAFSVSCFALVWLGCSLGALFRSGNFLGAFAISFVPAVICIALITMGQQHAQHIPYNMRGFTDPLPVGLSLIWSGNVINLVAAVALQWKLLRS